MTEIESVYDRRGEIAFFLALSPLRSYTVKYLSLPGDYAATTLTRCTDLGCQFILIYIHLQSLRKN